MMTLQRNSERAPKRETDDVRRPEPQTLDEPRQAIRIAGDAEGLRRVG
jgi:hypothetical protein